MTYDASDLSRSHPKLSSDKAFKHAVCAMDFAITTTIEPKTFISRLNAQNALRIERYSPDSGSHPSIFAKDFMP